MHSQLQPVCSSEFFTLLFDMFTDASPLFVFYHSCRLSNQEISVSQCPKNHQIQGWKALMKSLQLYFYLCNTSMGHQQMEQKRSDFIHTVRLKDFTVFSFETFEVFFFVFQLFSLGQLSPSNPIQTSRLKSINKYMGTFFDFSIIKQVISTQQWMEKVSQFQLTFKCIVMYGWGQKSTNRIMNDSYLTQILRCLKIDTPTVYLFKL